MLERGIFINYRSTDSYCYGALLHLDLKGHFGEDLVFFDCQSIPPGADFASELLGHVRSARVLLAVIGKHWLVASDPNGRRRIDDPDDWIRRELAEAFDAGVRVIPVLIDEAGLPREADLPGDIAALSRCQYRHLRRRETTSDLARIVNDLTALDPALAEAAHRRASSPRPRPPLPPSPVDELLRLLTDASWNQWAAAANDRRLLHPAPLPTRWRRSAAAVTGPASAAGYPRFDPLPGLAAVNSGDVHEGCQDALHEIYGGLPSGRLLLIGKPGSGKSAAAILLLLDALHHRRQATAEDRVQIPVPVLFTMHGWNPEGGDSATDWIAGKLAETYPMFRGRAGRRSATDLLTAGRIAVFLDGLDEIPETVRPHALDALADVPFRLVLLARTDEAVAAAHHRPLAGALAAELQPVRPADAASYLLQPLVDPPPEPWQKIHDHLTGATADQRQSSAVSTALSTPLALSMVRDVYRSTDPVDELLDDSRFPSAEGIENHLLDHAVTAAYTPRPGHPAPRYTVETAERALRYLATQLTERGTTDLAWWHIPTWTTHRSRLIMAAAMTVLANELVFGLSLGFVFGPALGLSTGLTFGLMTVIPLAIYHSRGKGVVLIPQRIARLTCRSAVRSLAFGLMYGIAGGLVAGLSTGLAFGLSVGLVSGLPVGLAAGLVGVALDAMARHTEVEDSTLGPADVWRHDGTAGLVHLSMTVVVVNVLAALTDAFAPGLAPALASRLWSVVPTVGLTVVFVVGLGLTLMARHRDIEMSSPGAAVLSTAMAGVELAIRHRTPVRLMAFLEDARNRHVLRTVGPVYQFRHATLQERLTVRPGEMPGGTPRTRGAQRG